MVAIWMITYNHEGYIRRAIEGVINQKTNFLFKLFIGEDCSTDNTRKICLELENAYPENIQVLCTQSNNIKENSRNIYDVCFRSKAKYIAMCEGDDYWSDEGKLQKQVNFLEENPDYNICHHGFKILGQEGNLFSFPDQNEIPSIYEIETLSKKNTIGTLTVMYRNIFSMPTWFFELDFGDYPLHLLNAASGKIKFLSEEMAVYRQHSQSTTGSLKGIERSLFLVPTLNVMANYFKKDEAVCQNLQLQIINLYLTIFFYYFDVHDDTNSNYYFDKIRSLSSLFEKDELNMTLLLQAYAWKIRQVIQQGDATIISALIEDFKKLEIKYLLQIFAEEAKLSNSLRKSKSYRIGNFLIKPYARLLSRIKAN